MRRERGEGEDEGRAPQSPRGDPKTRRVVTLILRGRCLDRMMATTGPKLRMRTAWPDTLYVPDVGGGGGQGETPEEGASGEGAARERDVG